MSIKASQERTSTVLVNFGLSEASAARLDRLVATLRADPRYSGQVMAQSRSAFLRAILEPLIGQWEVGLGISPGPSGGLADGGNPVLRTNNT